MVIVSTLPANSSGLLHPSYHKLSFQLNRYQRSRFDCYKPNQSFSGKISRGSSLRKPCMSRHVGSNRRQLSFDNELPEEPFWLNPIREIIRGLRSLSLFLVEQPSQLKYIEWPSFVSTVSIIAEDCYFHHRWFFYYIAPITCVKLKNMSILSPFFPHTIERNSLTFPGSAKQCEKQRRNAICSRGQWGFCGATKDHCREKNGRRSNCSKRDTVVGVVGSGGDGVSSVLKREMLEEMLPYRNDPRCPAAGFYTYDAFVAAAEFYPAFATTGDDATRKREIAAFFGQTSHETSGGRGWNAPGGSHSWGYCFNKQVKPPRDYLDLSNTKYPCVPGQKYFGRGPIQLTWNYNYGQFGATIGKEKELLENPDLLCTDPILCFQSSLWFWMTPQGLKPSCHDVIIGAWMPNDKDEAAGRLPGYGLITNIINPGECCRGCNAAGEDRIAFYKRYCDISGVSYGDNLNCYNQRNFGK